MIYKMSGVKISCEKLEIMRGFELIAYLHVLIHSTFRSIQELHQQVYSCRFKFSTLSRKDALAYMQSIQNKRRGKESNTEENKVFGQQNNVFLWDF